MIFTDFSGGLSNVLYLCEIADETVAKLDEKPHKVLLRIYGEIIRSNPETVITDSVIYGLLAEKKLGPKLFGVFTEGRIEEYLEVRKKTAARLLSTGLYTPIFLWRVKFSDLCEGGSR